MSDESIHKGSAKSLISSILKKPSVPQQEGTSGEPVSSQIPSESTPSDEEIDIANLIEIYFELEEPEERDALFDQITEIDSPLVDAFLESMFQEDNDSYVRSSAAAKLAGRGHPEAVALLERDLRDPQELFFFAQASQILGVIIGPSFYDTLVPIWNDDHQSPEIRQEALLGMENANPQATCAVAQAFLNTIDSVENFPEEKIEMMALIFARNNFTAGIQSLERIVTLVQTSALSSEEKQEHLGFLREALDLLHSPDPKAP